MRLIDADSLEKEFCSGCQYENNKYSNCIDCALARAPTIEERKTGEWIELDFTEAWEYKCDQCGRLSDFKDNFCPNCGADMRAKKK